MKRAILQTATHHTHLSIGKSFPNCPYSLISRHKALARKVLNKKVAAAAAREELDGVLGLRLRCKALDSGFWVESLGLAAAADSAVGPQHQEHDGQKPHLRRRKQE